jgi:hypothetical protein
MLEVPVEPTPYAIKVKVGAKDIERQESSNRDPERQPRFFSGSRDLRGNSGAGAFDGFPQDHTPREISISFSYFHTV